jgi:hypothetical protein
LEAIESHQFDIESLLGHLNNVWSYNGWFRELAPPLNPPDTDLTNDDNEDVQMEIEVSDQDIEMGDQIEDTLLDAEPTSAQIQDALNQAEQDAEAAAQAAIIAAEEDLEEELQAALRLDDTVQDSSEANKMPIGLLGYVNHQEEAFHRCNDQREEEAVAAQVLTGYIDSTREAMHAITGPPDREVSANELVFSVDIDSYWATFQAVDAWPFREQQEVQIYVVGPFHRRFIGTSKFRIDPSDQMGSNKLEWNERVCSPSFLFGSRS